MKTKFSRAIVATVAAVLSVVGMNAVAGYFDKASCDGSRVFAKRVFFIKQNGMTYAKYRKIEGDAPPGPAGDLVRTIERAIFKNPKITSEALAAEYAYSVCTAWR